MLVKAANASQSGSVARWKSRGTPHKSYAKANWHDFRSSTAHATQIIFRRNLNTAQSTMHECIFRHDLICRGMSRKRAVTTFHFCRARETDLSPPQLHVPRSLSNAALTHPRRPCMQLGGAPKKKGFPRGLDVKSLANGHQTLVSALAHLCLWDPFY